MATHDWFDGPITVIPAVDVLGTEAVRLRRGSYGDVVERGHEPAALAARWAAAGATRIDRDGTLSGPDLDLVGRAACSGARVLAAGGVRNPGDVDALAGAGAEAVVV